MRQETVIRTAEEYSLDRLDFIAKKLEMSLGSVLDLKNREGTIGIVENPVISEYSTDTFSEHDAQIYVVSDNHTPTIEPSNYDSSSIITEFDVTRRVPPRLTSIAQMIRNKPIIPNAINHERVQIEFFENSAEPINYIAMSQSRGITLDSSSYYNHLGELKDSHIHLDFLPEYFRRSSPLYDEDVVEILKKPENALHLQLKEHGDDVIVDDSYVGYVDCIESDIRSDDVDVKELNKLDLEFDLTKDDIWGLGIHNGPVKIEIPRTLEPFETVDRIFYNMLYGLEN